MATAQPSSTTTQTITETQTPNNIVLHLRKPKSDKKVKWEEEVVDNEFLGKKKSKCCCIYSKPHKEGESSDSEGEWDDCCHEHRVARRHIPKHN